MSLTCCDCDTLAVALPGIPGPPGPAGPPGPSGGVVNMSGDFGITVQAAGTFLQLG